MSDWIEDPFKAVIGGTIIIALAVAALTMGIATLSSIV
jgi:hypothetical protein